MARKITEDYEELVQKAQYLFWINGYKSVTAEELAEHLDVSTSTIYNKYSKDNLFIDALEHYVNSCSDPVLTKIRESTTGMESFREFFYMLIDALIDKTFPRSCLMVNTVVELRNENKRVTEVYDRYFGNMRESYIVVLKRAVALGEVKHAEKVEEYADFLLGVIFGLSILYKIKSREELKLHVDAQLSLIK